MMRSGITNLFRSLNANLLYRLPWPVEKTLKAVLYISEKCYRSWMKRPHEEEHVLVTNIDKDITMNVDKSCALVALKNSSQTFVLTGTGLSHKDGELLYFIR